ncbi:hypothetical protein EV356DRAFT_242209 [Viridothelium virens]|uniref:Uncharacterized protein n=1 Tax=Viridothelium virens TaxID=1048519 RepID=A0A6A6H4P6_VIRVR|nr:hypothetical protein EV356DRAFT_242209 [Viridothelium virens]
METFPYTMQIHELQAMSICDDPSLSQPKSHTNSPPLLYSADGIKDPMVQCENNAHAALYASRVPTCGGNRNVNA